MDPPNASVPDYDGRDTGAHVDGEAQPHDDEPKSRFSWGSSSYGDEDENGNRPCLDDNADSDQPESAAGDDTGLGLPAPTTGGDAASNLPGLAAGGDVGPDAPSLEGFGAWGCCECDTTSGVQGTDDKQHPATALKCKCGHHCCVNCTLKGAQIKKFQPMNEPEVVQLSEDANKDVRFGVFCSGCGTAWRAVEVETAAPKKTALQRISALPKRLLKHGMQPLEKLRHSSSLSNLSSPDTAPASASVAKATPSPSTFNLRALSNEMEESVGKQADLATVQFTGLQCTCGVVTDGSSLCFQIFDPPVDFYEAEFKKLMEGRRVAGFGTTPEDQARGHGTPTLTLKGISHPNPLRSAPVQEDDYKM
ncbi:hypothetical protein IQ07DRAFT_355075 [Pyrenochaeta sp. DS3sAY3a]|nr:hypothetical protein IQ07DRAFT_355075 [Pyrenochaeta sp. DS3sAY3a]